MPCFRSVQSRRRINRHLINKNARHYHSWIDFIVGELQLFSCIEREGYHRHSKYDFFSVDTLMKYFPKLTALVEQKVAALLPEKIALVFDGWKTGSVHYFACFAFSQFATTTDIELGCWIYLLLSMRQPCMLTNISIS